MNLEAINKWLDEEYGCSYTRLEELHDFYFEKYCDLKQENKQLKIQISAREEEYRELEDKYKELDKMCELYSKSLYNAELTQYKNNWNKLKEWASNFYNSEEVGWAGCGMRYMLEKMQEIEREDENE